MVWLFFSIFWGRFRWFTLAKPLVSPTTKKHTKNIWCTRAGSNLTSIFFRWVGSTTNRKSTPRFTALMDLLAYVHDDVAVVSLPAASTRCCQKWGVVWNLDREKWWGKTMENPRNAHYIWVYMGLSIKGPPSQIPENHFPCGLEEVFCKLDFPQSHRPKHYPSLENNSVCRSLVFEKFSVNGWKGRSVSCVIVALCFIAFLWFPDSIQIYAWILFGKSGMAVQNTSSLCVYTYIHIISVDTYIWWISLE